MDAGDICTLQKNLLLSLRREKPTQNKLRFCHTSGIIVIRCSKHDQMVSISSCSNCLFLNVGLFEQVYFWSRSRTCNMLKLASVVETWIIKLKLDTFDRALHTEHNITMITAVPRSLMIWDSYFLHHSWNRPTLARDVGFVDLLKQMVGHVRDLCPLGLCH